jgi:hypothetical protein
MAFTLDYDYGRKVYILKDNKLFRTLPHWITISIYQKIQPANFGIADYLGNLSDEEFELSVFQEILEHPELINKNNQEVMKIIDKIR